jgi:hypothetical protein
MDLNKQRLIKQCQISLGEEFDSDFLYFEDADFTSIKSIQNTYELFEKKLDGRTRAFKEKLKKLSYAKGSLGEDDIEEKSEKELDAKSLKDLIKNPSPKMIKQYGGKDKYIKMLKSKLAKLESSEIEEAPTMSQGMSRAVDQMYQLAGALAKGSRLNKGANKDLGGNYNSDFAKMEKAMGVVTDTFGDIIQDYKEISESAELEEAVKFWTVTITKKAGKLFKGQTVDVKARNSVEAINKGLKQMKVDPKTFPSDSVDAVLGESIGESTELFQKGKITFTKFSMGKNKGSGLQINYGRKYIQVPEKDIKQLYTALVYVTKSVPQFKI